MSVQATWSGCSVNETNSAGPGSYSMPLAAPTPGGTDSTGVVSPTGEPVAAAAAANGNGASAAAASSSVTAVNLTCQGERRYDAPSKVRVAGVRYTAAILQTGPACASKQINCARAP
jgi:hypothetical protein